MEKKYPIDPQEVWDQFSEYVDDDVDSLSRYAGRTVMLHDQFLKAIKEFTQAASPANSATQPILTDEDVKAWEDMKKEERASTRESEPYEPNARLRYWKERAIKSEARQSARWVSASERLPASWHLKCVRFIHTKVPLLDPAAWLEKNPDHINLVEWLDEEGGKGEGKV
jgi:hypothetical protein